MSKPKQNGLKTSLKFQYRRVLRWFLRPFVDAVLIVRFYTTFRLHMWFTRFIWYKRWAEFKYSEVFHVLLLIIFLISLSSSFAVMFKPAKTEAAPVTYYARASGTPNFTTTDGPGLQYVNSVDDSAGGSTMSCRFGKYNGSTYTWWVTTNCGGAPTAFSQQTLNLGEKLAYAVSGSSNATPLWTQYYTSADVGTANSGVAAGTITLLAGWMYNDEFALWNLYVESNTTRVTGIDLIPRASGATYYAKSSGTPNFATTDGSASALVLGNGTDSGGSIAVEFGKKTGASYTSWGSSSTGTCINCTSSWSSNLTLATNQTLAAGDKFYLKISTDGDSGSLSKYYESDDVGTTNSAVSAGTLPFTVKFREQSYALNIYEGASQTYIGGINLVPRASNQNPNNPASLTEKTSPGGATINESAYITDNTPDLGFTISDPDGADTVKYEVQLTAVADTSFSSPILDYTHGSLSASGTTFAFTVGSYVGGTCTGTCPATLPDSSAGYLWRVKAIDNSGASSGWIEPGVAGTADIKVDATGPTTPTALNFSNLAATSLTLNWTGSTDAASGLSNPAYFIERAPDSDGSPGTFVGIGTSSIGTATFNDSSLSPNAKYWYRVRAKDVVANYSSYSSNANTITLTNVPTSPDASATSSTQINVSWSAPASGGVNHYHVYSSSDNYTSPIYNSTGTSTSQPSLNANTQYTYRIYGVNINNVESSSFATISRYTLTGVPSTFTASGVAPGRINLSWAAPVGGATSYDVYSSSDNYSAPIFTGSSLSTYQTGLTPNTSYTYRIYSVNDSSIESATYATVTAYTLTIAPVLNTLPVFSNNNKPTISNADTIDSSLANMVVHIYDGTTELGWVTANGWGVFEFNSTMYLSPLAEGIHDNLRVTAENAVGIESSYSDPVSTTIDVTKPTTGNNAVSGWSKESVTVVLDCSDSTAGCANTYYTVDGSVPTTDSDSGSTIILNNEGIYTIKYFSVDNAGNQEQVKIATNQIKIDKTKPSAPGIPSVTTRANDNTPHWQWVASTDSGSGLSTPAYTLEWSKDNNFTNNVVTASINDNSFTHESALSDGKWYFRVKSSDLAGNQTDFSTGSFTVNSYVPPSTPSPSIPPTSEGPTPTPTAETPSTPAPTLTTEEKAIQKPSAKTEKETFTDMIVDVFQDIPSATGKIFSSIGNTVWTSSSYILQTAGFIAVSTGESIASIYYQTISSTSWVVNNAGRFGSGVVYGSRNLVAVITFSLGEKTELISDKLGQEIVEFGYFCIGEPTEIHNVRVTEVSSDSATISWDTNTLADGKVNYGLSETYELSVQSSNNEKNHSFVLTNLKPDTQYHFEVMSQGKTYVYDANRKFRTLK